MSKCISGRHNYEHLGTSCAEMDDKLRVMREVALGDVTLTSSTGPVSVWDENGFPVLDAVLPDGIDAASGMDVYASGFIGTARDDSGDEQDA